ncbi:MAG: tRNA glutamyl-Q(34) synthetase GluQRS [bacterium]|nr:tRNA glutamyl-Q(34) synthetase GluQRS [bacterium]
MTPPRGRYAPSPTGELHLGNASSALLAWLSIRARGGTFVMRMEDLDRNRSRDDLARRALEDLAWFGLDWDEGPDVGGDRGPYDQGSRTASYDAAFERLREAGRVFPCFCSRKDLAAAASAPQEPGDEAEYPGTCRDLPADEAQRRIDDGARHAWRYRLDGRELPAVVDLVHGSVPVSGCVGDFVVRRAFGEPAYQLAVVVDDAAMGITEVVRGDDLLSSTVRQLLLYGDLGEPAPQFGHVPLLMGADGHRLSKRHRGITLREMREDGWTAEAIVGRLAEIHALRPTHEPIAAADLVDGFDLTRLRPLPGGIEVRPETWRGGST